jgi:aspartyl-tRNA(Asn)/glutamyl-tRNA(Gln) amidotransferase subunit A
MYSISELSELLRQKELSPIDVTKSCLEKIEELNPTLNAFITVTADEALKQAADAEKEIRSGQWKGPLHGIPIALKDLVDTAGIKTTAGSAVFQNRIPTEDAQIVRQLKKAGAVMVGKTNMHEFAIGATSHISFFGPVRNPWNSEYVAGGSSGGSAVAVATGMCCAAIGSDTGGSNRVPPACCGVVGLKPTHGLISTMGVVPMSKSFDHIGPICRTVEDTAIMLNALVDEDLAHVAVNLKDYTKFLSKKINPRVAILSNTEFADESKDAFETVKQLFQSFEWQIIRKDLPLVPTSGIELRNAEIQAMHKPLVEKYRDLYNPVTLARMENTMDLEKNVDSVSYIHNVDKMNEDRLRISAELLRDCDIFISPTTSAPVTLDEANAQGPVAMSLRNTLPFNYYGLPAISIPCGFTRKGLPLGLQIVGPRWGEEIVLAVAHYYEQQTKWHLQHPG